MKKSTKKFTIEQVKEKFNTTHGDKYDYSLFVDYNNTRQYIDIRCKKHTIFNQQIAMHLVGQGCPECKKEKLSEIYKFKLDDIISKFKAVHGDKYDYSEIKEYNGCDEYVNIICKKHGGFKQNARNHYNGQGCQCCYNDVRHLNNCSNLEEFTMKSKIVHGEKYDYSKCKYINSKTPIEIVCPIHGSFFKKPNNHLNGKEGCPMCFSSNGEKKIFSILVGNNIQFERQKMFNDCKYIKSLRFDFYIPEYNMCIEYNGQQHYIEVKSWGGEENYLLNVKKDKIKNDYCIDNNINLIIVSYTDDIYAKLNNFFENLEDFDDIYNNYLTLEEARLAIKKLNIKNQIDYHKKYKMNGLLPSHPESVYKNCGWIGWSYFFDNKK